MDGTNMTPADIAALTKNGDGSFSQAGMWWVLLIFLLAGGGGWGGNRGPAVIESNGVTQADLTAGLNNNAIQSQLQSLALQTANNDFNTVNAINGQTNALIQQNSANTINAIQGFNAVNQNLLGLQASLGSKLDNLGYQMENCCCSIKTQMLQDRNADLQNIVNQQYTQISNNQQTAQLLGITGRYVAWEPSGSSTATVVTG